MDKNSYIKNSTSIKRKCISVDTLFRPNYNNTSSSDFLYVFPKPIENVLSMKITSIELPNFWYTFSQHNMSNEFTIHLFNFYQYDDATKNTVLVKNQKHRIVIPEGNYFDTDLVQYINSYFLNIKGGLEFLYFDINTNNGKTIFRARHKLDNLLFPSAYETGTPYYSPSFYYVLDFNLDGVDRPLYHNMGWTLGFKQSRYIVTNSNAYNNLFVYNDKGPIQYGGYLLSESTYGNTLGNYLFLDIEDYNRSFSNDKITSCLNSSYLEGNNIIARLSVNTSSNSINFTNGSDVVFKKRQYFGPVSIEKIYIRILDKYGNVLPLNGNDFSFFIEMEVMNK